MADSTAPVPPGDRSVPPVEPVRLVPQLSRRPAPSLVVHVDGSASGYGALVWALREAARREGTVLAVDVVDGGERTLSGQRAAAEQARAVALERIEAQVVRAIGETGVTGRVRIATLERPLLEALVGAGRGGDLVLVNGSGRALLRQVTPRSPARRLAHGA
ncbi:universal stress protein [Geodermatophilus sp. SYSU D00684]